MRNLIARALSFREKIDAAHDFSNDRFVALACAF
jgi:hypothetical protein